MHGITQAPMDEGGEFGSPEACPSGQAAKHQCLKHPPSPPHARALDQTIIPYRGVMSLAPSQQAGDVDPAGWPAVHRPHHPTTTAHRECRQYHVGGRLRSPGRPRFFPGTPWYWSRSPLGVALLVGRRGEEASVCKSGAPSASTLRRAVTFLTTTRCLLTPARGLMKPRQAGGGRPRPGATAGLYNRAGGKRRRPHTTILHPSIAPTPSSPPCRGVTGASPWPPPPPPAPPRGPLRGRGGWRPKRAPPAAARPPPTRRAQRRCPPPPPPPP